MQRFLFGLSDGTVHEITGDEEIERFLQAMRGAGNDVSTWPKRVAVSGMTILINHVTWYNANAKNEWLEEVTGLKKREGYRMQEIQEPIKITGIKSVKPGWKYGKKRKKNT